MAYDTKYTMHYSTKETEGWVYLQKKDYSGSATTLKILEDGLQIDYKLSDWFSPIMGQSLTVEFLNDSGDFWAYKDLFAANEREWKVKVYARTISPSTAPVLIFDGWMDSEVTQVEYKNNSKISLSASQQFSKLKYRTADIMEDSSTGIESLYDVLNGQLKLTQEDSPYSGYKDLYLNLYLEPSANWAIWNANSPLNRCGVEIENFANNTDSFLDPDKIIEGILKPFNAYLYQWKGKWYVERYKDMYTEDGYKLYKVYDGDHSYGYLDEIDSSYYGYEPSINLCDLLPVGSNPNMSITPGLKTIKIKKELNEYSNYTTTNFTAGKPFVDWELDSSLNVIINRYPRLCRGDNESLQNTLPPLKGWNMRINSAFNHYFNLFQHPPKAGWAITQRGAEKSYKRIGNPIYRVLYPTTGTDTSPDWLLATRFKCTAYENIEDPSTFIAGSSLNIKFKYAPNYAITPNASAFADKEMNYKIRWTLRDTMGANYGSASQFYIRQVKPDEDDESTWYWEHTWANDLPSNISDAINETVISASSLDKWGVADIDISIPLADVSGMVFGDRTYVWHMLIDQFNYDGGAYSNMFSAHYGDFVISLDGPLNDDTFVGIINEDVFEEKEISLIMSDVSSWNTPSGVRYFSSYGGKTDKWREVDWRNLVGGGDVNEVPGNVDMPLTHWLLNDRFKLYGQHRKKLSFTCKYGGFIKPFTFVYDNHDPSATPYVITNYSYHPTIDKYNIDMWEYSNDQITIS